MKIVIVFFDVEGWYEVPFRGKFDFEDNMARILEILKEYGVKAAFNVCGIMAENFPEVIERLYKEGHEIASHGYVHENFSQLSQQALNKVLEKTEEIIQNIICEKPLGIRAPWLKYGENFYGIINRRGYKWASNKASMHVEQLYRPDLLSTNRRSPIENLGTSMLRSIHSLKWFFYKKKPFKMGDLYEIPLLSSLDGDLLGQVDTSQRSPDNLLDFAYESLRNQYNACKKFFNLNFHDWLIGSANRPLLLRRVLDYISNQEEVKFILPREIVHLAETEKTKCYV